MCERRKKAMEREEGYEGFVQVYTGNGKGKTTAAIGIAMRMVGAGGKVLFMQFMKGQAYSEQKILSNMEPDLIWEAIGKPFFVAKKGTISEEDLASYGDGIVVFPPGEPPQIYVDMVADGFARATEAMASGEYDMVVLDEINCAMYFELIPSETVLDGISKKAKKTEVILTGRQAPPEIIEAADLVTEMKEIKHYFTTKGITSRKGIEN